MREYDLSLRAFFKRHSISLEAYATVPSLLRDGKGRLLLEVDAEGRALRRDGEVVPRAYTRWIRVECAGRTIDCGIGEATDGRELARTAKP